MEGGGGGGGDRVRGQQTLIRYLDIDKYQRHLLHFIINNHVPLTILEDSNFCNLLTTFNPSIQPHLIKANAFRDSIKKEYIRSSALVKQLLVTALSRIHISFDLWTSPNGIAILGVATHFVNIYCQNQSVLIGMKRMEYSYTGEDIAEQLAPLLEEYGIVLTLGVFISDNVDVNNIAIKSTLRRIRPDINDITGRRSRCLGHIINLAAQAFIFGKNIKAFEAVIGTVNEVTPLNSKIMQTAQAE
jgi:hypothetical protein